MSELVAGCIGWLACLAVMVVAISAIHLKMAMGEHRIKAREKSLNSAER